jgi:hypothetical protein
MERATGHVFDFNLNQVSPRKILNVTLPKIHETLWSADATRLIARYLRDDGMTIRTFSAKVSSTTVGETSLEGVFLPDTIEDISIVGSKVFYINEDMSGGQGIVAEIDGTKKTPVFNSSFGDWQISGAGQSLVTLSSRPSAFALGHSYSLNTRTGDYSKIVGERYGLATKLNSTGTWAIFSETGNGQIKTSLLNIKTGEIKDAGIQTLADKCLWSSKKENIIICAVPQATFSGTYPDDWYKGKLSFNDSLWSIDTFSGQTKQIMSPEIDAGVSMDIIKLGFNQSENYIIFTNKKDMTVWSYRLTP